MDNTNSKSKFSFLQGGGEMGERIRNFPWENTIIGNPDQWPQSLRTTLSTILHSNFPMFIWWGEDLIQFYNDAYRPSFGTNGKHPAALGQRGEDCWPEIWPTIKPLIDRVFILGESTWSEDQLIPIHRNGELEDVYWTFSYSPIIDEAGRPRGVLVICSETTKTVLAHQRVQNSEQSLRNIIMQAPVAMCIFRGPNHIVEIANDRMFEFWGKSAEAVLSKPIFEALPEATGQGFEALVDEVYRTGENYRAYGVPITLPRKNGAETVYIDFVYEAFRETNDEISGVIAVAIDVTKQVMAGKKIEEAEGRARMAIESAELGLYEIEITRPEKMFTDARFNHIMGLDRSVRRSKIKSVIHPEDLPVYEKAQKEALVTGLLNFEVRIIRKDKSVHWVKTTGKLIYGHNHKAIKILGVVQDTTGQKEIEHQKDDFISMVSHELKTPLTSLRVYSEILTEKFTALQDKESTGMLTKMSYQVNRLIYIVQDLLDVSRIESGKINFREDHFDLGELIIEIVDEVQHTTSSHHILIDNIEHVPIFSDKERISQVLTNLLTNAIRYSPKANKVIVATCLQNKEVVCSIKDFGSGITKDKQVKIFERFYQISEVNRFNAGFGLGLYISAQIIKRQKGKIWVESEPGKGSTFYFSLPLYR